METLGIIQLWFNYFAASFFKAHAGAWRGWMALPLFETIGVLGVNVFCIEESTCDVVGTFRPPHSDSVLRGLSPARYTLSHITWRSQPKIFLGGNMFDFRRITLVCLEKRLSKHKMTMFSKNFGGTAPLPPPGYAYGHIAYTFPGKLRREMPP